MGQDYYVVTFFEWVGGSRLLCRDVFEWVRFEWVVGSRLLCGDVLSG